MLKYIKVLIVLSLLVSCQSSSNNTSTKDKIIYGVTLDSIDNINQSVDYSLKSSIQKE